MSFLFTIENKIVKPNTETLLVSPFKEIWKRDKSSKKDRATQEFTYIEFMVSLKKTNPYRGYTPQEREQRICKDIMKDEKYKPDKLVKEGISVLQEFQETASPTSNYYKTALKAAYKTQTFFEEFDYNTRNEKTGAFLHKPKEVTSSLADTARVLEILSALEEKVNNELFENTKIKGQKIVSVLSNPDTL